MEKLIDFSNSTALHETTSDAHVSDVGTNVRVSTSTDVLLSVSGVGGGRTLLQQSGASELDAEASVQEAGVLLSALTGYFDVSSHAFAEGISPAERDWSAELSLAERNVSRAINILREISVELRHASSQTTDKRDGEPKTGDSALFGATDATDVADAMEGLDHALDASLLDASIDGANVRDEASINDALRDLNAENLGELIEALLDVQSVAQALVAGGQVNVGAWSGLGHLLKREIRRTPIARVLMRRAAEIEARMIHPLLLTIASQAAPDALRQDLLIIFTNLSGALERLRNVERKLAHDEPLKQTHPVFLSIREQLGWLLALIETRTMRIEDLSGTVFDSLDSTSYAVGMELRRVFAQELLDFATLRHQPSIYHKAEAAHGLLRDSLQQSLVALAQTFKPDLDGAQLFDTFRIKREQSIKLREDLWIILQLLLRAEQERDARLNPQLEEQLERFRQTSMRYLMFKDWETLERFIEEAAFARSATELMPVVHRFGTYVETLFGQVNMRAVLADVPFEQTVRFE